MPKRLPRSTIEDEAERKALEDAIIQWAGNDKSKIEKIKKEVKRIKRLKLRYA